MLLLWQEDLERLRFRMDVGGMTQLLCAYGVPICFWIDSGCETPKHRQARGEGWANHILFPIMPLKE